MEKKTVINADDFGLCDGVNDAVEQACVEGVLTSATIMANMPAAEGAVTLAKKLPELGVGVHLNLFEGLAMSKDDTALPLVNSRREFKYSPGRLAVLSVISAKIRRAIAVELETQIRWVVERDICPTHLDSHQHIHCFPTVFKIACELANKFDIRAIRWVYEPKEVSQLPWPLLSQSGKKKAKILRPLARLNKFQNAELLKNEGLLGISHGRRMDMTFFKAAAIYNPANTIEIMTHPAINDSSSRKANMIDHRRKTLEALCDKRTKTYFEEANIKLVSYRDI